MSVGLAHATPSSPVQHRSQWLDACKGLGIALIFLGHIGSVAVPSTFYEVIYSFHVPLFFFVAGLTLKPTRDAPAVFVAQKAHSLLRPYLVYALLGFLFYLCGYTAGKWMGLTIEQFSHGLWPPFFGVFYGSLGDGHLVNTPLWFLPALFFALLLAYGLNRTGWPEPVRLVAALALAALGVWAADWVKLPFSLSCAAVGLVFVQCGFWCGVARLEALSPTQLWVGLAIALAVTALSPLNGFVTLANMQLGQPLLYALFALSGTAVSVLLCQLLSARAHPLAWLGRYSLPILLIHMLVIKSAKVLLAVALGRSIGAVEQSTALFGVVLLLSALGTAFAVLLMERFVPWTLGKEHRHGVHNPPAAAT